MARLRISLRVKLALAAVALLSVPWAGAEFVSEMERFLLDGQEQALEATARAVATALHDRPQLLVTPPARDTQLRREAEEELRHLAEEQGAPVAPEGDAPARALARESEVASSRAQEEIAAILRGVQRTSSRIWVVNRRYQVLALAGSLKRAAEKERPQSWFRAAWEAVASRLIRQPTEDFAEVLPDDVLATGRDIASALQGTPGTRTRRTPDGRAVVISAAHPIWSGDEVVGAVVVEETTNPVVSLTSEALERLLALTLVAFLGAAALLMGYATRLSQRIRRLRDEAESAIDARGRITQLASGSDAGDEIGDLSRSFSQVLERLAQHHAYLESIAGRLSHELRTPIAVVRSSLENLKVAPSADGARVYIERAEEGLARLNMILQRMTEANRLEQSLRTAERENYDLVPVVRGCVEGYRLAYPQTRFVMQLPNTPVIVAGSPDLAAQLLDKLAANAVDFSAAAEPISVGLTDDGSQALLTMDNKGPVLADEVKQRLFDSMISVRSERGAGAPHLGLGLYVARLIAEFHGGSIRAENLPGADGVRVRVVLPIAF